MGSSSDSAAEQDSFEGSLDPSLPENGSKGFFGRLISAFSSNEAEGPSKAASASLLGFAALRRMSVDDVAISKAEIVAVPLDSTKDELVEAFRTHGFSRLPVYKDSLDQPQGLVLLKDFALQCGFGSQTEFDLQSLLRPVLYAPPSMPAAMLLQQMQKDRAHLALVIDEYGGVDGLVTIEDLIETVVGQIEDEHDEEVGALWKEEAPGVILAQSTADLDALEAALSIRLRADDDDGEIDTLGGLVFLRTGHVPQKGEVVVLDSGAVIEVVDADVRRIKLLRLRLPGAAAAAAKLD